VPNKGCSQLLVNKSISVRYRDTTQAYVDRSGCVQSSLVGDGVAQLEWICGVAIKETVVNVNRLNDDKTVSSRNAVTRRRVTGDRALLVGRLTTQQRSYDISTVSK